MIDDLILYRNFKFQEMVREFYSLSKKPENLSSVISKILQVAGEYGLKGNLWKNILALSLAGDENEYSKSTEITGEVPGSINAFALHDLHIFKELFHYMPDINNPLLDEIYNYKGSGKDSKVVNTRIRDRILQLSNQLQILNLKILLPDFTRNME